MTPRLSRWSGLALLIGTTLVISLVPIQAQDNPDYNAEIKKRIAEWETPSNPNNKFAWTPLPAPGTGTTPFTGSGLPTDPKGYSIHIAVSRVNPAAYPRPVDQLPATKNDLKRMKEIAVKKGFTVLKELVDEGAERKDVIKAITDAKDLMKSGDILLITYSGHGSQIEDTNGDEPDGWDETWCLFDGHLIDDQLVALWASFPEGARIVVTLDSCHSETATRGLLPADVKNFLVEKKEKNIKAADFLQKDDKLKMIQSQAVKNRTIQNNSSRLLPIEAMLESYAVKEEEYKTTQRNLDLTHRAVLRDPMNTIKATVITLGACADDQTALDNNVFGFFTKALSEVWTSEGDNKGYASFLNKVAAIVKPRAQAVRDSDGRPHQQDPKYTLLGKRNPAFEDQAPFTIK